MNIEDFHAKTSEITEATLSNLSRASDRESILEIQRRSVGRNGAFKELQRMLGTLPSEDRPAAGEMRKVALAATEAAIADALLDVDRRVEPMDPSVDPTLPAIPFVGGGMHPITQMMHDLNDAFAALNFDVYSGPEISDEATEFDAMNFPPDHPARESMDTYWIDGSAEERGVDRLCLRPHLTGASVRYLREHEPPHRFVYPGRVYRNESTDARHERAFFQYEALIVDRVLPFSAGKLLVSTILDTVFGTEVLTRMRTGFFPFVEPGFEIDMQCQVCAGVGCSVCKHVGWLEIMPGGVPHPNVLRAGGLDPDEWTGFYINVGLDRLVMMRYGIDDIRLFNGCDLRFLGQFK